MEVIMKKWDGWVVRKQYFKVQVEADTWIEAFDAALDVKVDTDNANHIDWDVCNVEEIK
jgi:hypothetical protein